MKMFAAFIFHFNSVRHLFSFFILCFSNAIAPRFEVRFFLGASSKVHGV